MLLKRKNIVGALRTVTVALAALVYLLLVSGCGTMLQDLQDARIITAEQALYIQEDGYWYLDEYELDQAGQ